MKKHVAMALALAGGVLAASAIASPVISVCAEPWAPFIDSDQAKPATGLAAEVISRVAEAGRWRVRYVFKSAGACIRLARQGQVDVLAFAGAADSPPGWMQTRQPLVYWILGAWVAADSPHTAFTDLAAFSGQRVGWVTAYDYPLALKRKQDWQRVDVIDTTRGMRMLLGGRMDVMFDDALAGSGLPPAQRTGLRLLRPLVGSVSQPVSVRPGLAALRDGIDAEAVMLRKNGQLDAFYQHHFGHNLSQVLGSLH